MDNPVPKGSAVVLPAGHLPLVKLEGESHKLVIELVTTDPLPEALVVYPDGYKKFHQAADMRALLGKIGGTLKGRYGIEAFKIEECPKHVERGRISITLEGA